jgi:Lon protease-like protein
MPAERLPLEVHLDNMTADERELWDRYVELVEAAGQSELIVTKSGMAFRAPHSRFTGGFFRTRRLELFFDLPEPVPEKERDRRFREVWQHSRTKWVHRLKIERPEELDDKLRGWLGRSWEAYAKPAAER